MRRLSASLLRSLVCVFLAVFLVAGMLPAMNVYAASDVDWYDDYDDSDELLPEEEGSSQPEYFDRSASAIKPQEEEGFGFAETSIFVPEGKKKTPELTGELPEGAYFTTSSKSILSVSSTSGAISGKKLGHAVISVCVKQEDGSVVTLDTIDAYCFRPSTFSIKKTGNSSSSPDPYRLLTVNNPTSEYTNRTYALFRQHFDKANDYVNYPWLHYHGCSAVAVADICQGYGAEYVTQTWLSDAGISIIGQQSGLSASTIDSKVPSEGDAGSPLGFTGMQDVLAYAGISSKIGTWTAENKVPAVESITKALSEARPVVVCIYSNKWDNPRTGQTISLASTYHFILLTGIDEEGYILNSCGSSANVQTNNSVNGYEVKITVAELLEHFIRYEKYAERTKTSDFFYGVKGGSGSMVWLEVTSDHIEALDSALPPATMTPNPGGTGKTDISDRKVTLSETVYTYNAKARKPAVTVEGLNAEDYTVSYSNNVNAGTAVVTVTGQGSYTGTIEKTFEIQQADVSRKTMTLSADTFVYTGSQCIPAVTVDGLMESDYTVDYQNNVNAGTASVIVTGSGKNCQGTLTQPFTIKPALLDEEAVTLSQDTFTYTGEECRPEVEFGVEVTDYSTAYSEDIVNAGEASVFVTGLGNYTGTVEKTFTIQPAQPTITASSKKVTTSSEKQKVKLGAVSSHDLKLKYKSSDSTVKVSSSGSVTIPADYVGKVTITISSSETENFLAAKKKVSVTVNPKKPTISSVESSAKKTLTVKWKKKSSVTGYQLQYSYKSDFSKATTVKISKNSTVSKKITKLTSGKKCYVRMRTYQTVSDTKYYSSWTSAKSVKIK